MKIQENSFVALEYTLKIDSGETVDKSEAGDPLSFIMGSGQMIPGLERQVIGMEAGQSAVITVIAEEAYGPSRPDLLREVPRSSFPDDADLAPGMVFEANGPHGAIPMLVKEISADTVTVDLNHPLAGQQLTFDIRVAEVREATEEELAELDDEGEGCCGEHECHGCGAH